MRYLIAACLVVCPSVVAAQQGYAFSSDSTVAIVTSRSPMTDTLDAVIIYQVSDSAQVGWQFQIAATCFDTATTGRMRDAKLTVGFKPAYNENVGYYLSPDSARLGRSTALMGATDIQFYSIRTRLPPAPLVVSRGWRAEVQRGFGVAEVEAGAQGSLALFGRVLADTTETTTLYLQLSVGSAAYLISDKRPAIRQSAGAFVARFEFTPEKKQLWRNALQQCGLPWRRR